MNTKNLGIPIRTTRQYIILMTGVLQLTGNTLTDTEIDVLSCFVNIKKEIDKNGMSINPFSTEMKKEAAKRLGRDDFNTLNNYIKSFHDKGVIKKTDGGYEIIPLLVPGSEDGILIKFKK